MLPLHAKRREVTAEDLMELQHAASSLRSLCVSKETENNFLLRVLRDYEKQLFILRTNELLLKREISMWTSYHSFFVQPFYNARILLEKCRFEEQLLLISKAARERDLVRQNAVGTRERLERKNAALLAQVQQLEKQREELSKATRQMETRLRRVLEDSREARGKVSKLQGELEIYAKRLERSEVERERAQRHLSAHVAALGKLDKNTACFSLFEDEIRARDAIIAQLQKTVREMNAFIGQRMSSRSESTTDSKAWTPLQRQSKDESPTCEQRVTDQRRSSERLRQSIQRLRRHLENEGGPLADKSYFSA